MIIFKISFNYHLGGVFMSSENLKYVHGYKAFNPDQTNRYGVRFEEGETYKSDGVVSFGVNSTGGFHMCRNLEDTLIFFEGLPEDPIVAEVEGSGKIVCYDGKEDYYDLYSVENLKIKRFLTREEMLMTILDDPHIYDDRVCRFIEGVRMDPAEIELFKELFEDSPKILKSLAFHQENDKEVYSRDYNKYR